MNTVIYPLMLQLDVIDDADTTVAVMQTDNLTRIIRARFYDKDSQEQIDKSAIVQLVMARPDNKILWLDCKGMETDDQEDYYSTIECVITGDMIAIPGNGMGQFLIWNAEKTEVIRSQKFRIKVGRKLDNLDAQEGDPAYGALQEMLDAAIERKYGELASDLEGLKADLNSINKKIESGEIGGTSPEAIDAAVAKYIDDKGISVIAGADGYTPVKGVDYFDGKDGKDGLPSVINLQMKLNDAPNATNPLNIQMDYSSMPLHPSVLFFENKFGGYYFWMAYTPYPYHQDDKENPCICCSNDMVNWHTPDGVHNPFDVGTGKDYNSDTELVYNYLTGKLEMWWRRANTTTKDETLYRVTTSNGTDWSAIETMGVFNGNNGQTQYCLCPMILFEDGVYKMWAYRGYIYAEMWYYGTSVDGKTWNDEPVKTNILGWHGDIIHTEKGYELIQCDQTATQTDSWAWSEDGITWNDKTMCITTSSGTKWDSTRLYRPSFIKVDGIYYVFYSAMRDDFVVNGIGLSVSTRYDDIKSLRGYAGSEVPLFTFAQFAGIKGELDDLKSEFPIRSIELDRDSYSGSDENDIVLHPTVVPSFSKAYTWYSDNESVARVNEVGRVSPTGSGVANIYCKSIWDDLIKAGCSVEFINESGITYVDGIVASFHHGYFNLGYTLAHGVDSWETKFAVNNGTFAGNANNNTAIGLRTSAAQSEIDYMWGARPRLKNTNPSVSSATSTKDNPLGIPFIASYDADSKILRYRADGYEDAKYENFSGSSDGTSMIVLGGGADNGGKRSVKGIFYYFTIGDKYDFRPAVDESGKVCLYDRINKVKITPSSYDNLMPWYKDKDYVYAGVTDSTKFTLDKYPVLVEYGDELVIKATPASGYTILSSSNIRDGGGSGKQYMIDMDTMTITVPEVTSILVFNIYTGNA